MKIAFSTLGCPDWTWSEIFATAKDMSFDGIEVRGVANEIYVPHAKRFTPEKIDGTIKKLNDGNMEIPMLTSGASLGENSPTALTEAKEYIDIANKLSCKYIRVLISSHPNPEEVNLQQAISLYQEICEYGEQKNVKPLIETNGVLANSKAMKDFLSKIKSENKGVLWDIHHPYRFKGEAPEQTLKNLGAYIKYTHIKDSVMVNGKVEYCLIGEGDLPIDKAMRALNSINYDGYVSLEWIKKYAPNLSD
ncbi:MAG: sugar phosphate isomerase/epimerase family protein, partial [Oscillospiraceae bacterium]